MQLGPQVVSTSDAMHVFYVQSYLSFSVCCGIIILKNIPPESVVFILDRGLVPKTDYRCVPVLPRLRAGPRLSWRAIVENRKARAEIRNFMQAITDGRSFELYINRMNYPFLNVIRTQKNCTAINIFEEGLAAYCRQCNEKSPEYVYRWPQALKRNAIFALSGFSGRHGKFFYDASYARAFAAGEKAFAGFPRRDQIDLRSIIEAYDRENTYSSIPENAVIFVMPLANKLRTNPLYAERMADALTSAVRLTEGRRELFLQTHPDQFHDEVFWESIYGRVREKTGVELKEKSIENYPLESVAERRPDIGFCMLISSVAIYAKSLGRDVVSFAPGVFESSYYQLENFRAACPDITFCDEMLNVPDSALSLPGKSRKPPMERDATASA